MSKDEFSAQVSYGLETIDPRRTVTIPLRDLLQTYKAIGELVRFFHQPLHWRHLKDVKRFVGTKSTGALGCLVDLYYARLRDVWPSDVARALEDGEFDQPYESSTTAAAARHPPRERAKRKRSRPMPSRRKARRLGRASQHL